MNLNIKNAPKRQHYHSSLPEGIEKQRNNTESPNPSPHKQSLEAIEKYNEELEQLNQPMRIVLSSLSEVHQQMTDSLKQRLEECTAELESMRNETSAQLELSNQQRALYKNKLLDEKKRTAMLLRDIAAMETEMVNTPGYSKVVELEGEKRTMNRQLQEQQIKIDKIRDVRDQHQKIHAKEERDKVAIKKRADEYRLQADQLDREVKQNKKELYESQKKAIQANMEIDRWKEKNQDLLVSVEIVKRDPKMAHEIN